MSYESRLVRRVQLLERLVIELEQELQALRFLRDAEKRPPVVMHFKKTLINRKKVS